MSSIITVLINLNIKLNEFLKNVLVFFSPKIVKIKLVEREIILTNKGKDSLTRVLIKENGVWEEDELKLFSVISSGASTFVDIGANIGLYTILAEKCNPKIRSYSFEPAPANARRMNINFKLNNIKNCLIVENAVGDKNGMISFFVPEDDSSTSVSSTSKDFTSSWHANLKEINVKQTTLDNFVEENKINKIDLIKLDAEYHELKVLTGAKVVFQTQKPAVLCEVNIYEILTYYLPSMKEKISKSLSNDIEAFFREINYFVYSIGKDGLMRVDSIHIHPDVRNFLFSSVKSDQLFIPYNDIRGIQNLISK